MERRKHIRRAIETHAWVRERQDRRPSFRRTADLSRDGARFTWLRPMVPGTPLLVQVQLGENGPALECKARVCWGAPSHNGLHQFGVRFMDMGDEEAEELEKFCSVTKARPVLAAV